MARLQLFIAFISLFKSRVESFRPPIPPLFLRRQTFILQEQNITPSSSTTTNPDSDVSSFIVNDPSEQSDSPLPSITDMPASMPVSPPQSTLPTRTKRTTKPSTSTSTSTPGSVGGDEDSFNPQKPRTAADIKSAYEKRMANKALIVPEDLGFFAPVIKIVKKLQDSYFFGFFESLDEPSEADKLDKQKADLKTPWFLKPYLTFPIAFAVVGAAFAFVIMNGGIYQRGFETEVSAASERNCVHCDDFYTSKDF